MRKVLLVVNIFCDLNMQLKWRDIFYTNTMQFFRHLVNSDNSFCGSLPIYLAKILYISYRLLTIAYQIYKELLNFNLEPK